jgi:hypothetical protein
VPLYAWVIERLKVAQLKSLLTSQSVQVEKSARQLGLLQSLLTEVVGTPESEARAALGPLSALNELRAKAAHLAKPDYAALLPRLGSPTTPGTARRYWDAIVDAVANSLNLVAEKVRGE